jgi:hypothetical protein
LRKKTYLIIVALFLIGCLVTPVLGLQSLSQSISSYGKVSYDSDIGWLHTERRSIVDEDGNIIILRGANFMGYEFGAWDTHTEEDYARMASWGFNVVRLPIIWRYIEPQPGVYDPSFFTNYVDRDIAWAKKYGIYIILDMHQNYWSNRFTYHNGYGLPSWMVSGYPNNATGLGQAITDFWLGKGPNGTVASPANPSMQDLFIALWKYVAERYANETTIAAYDLFNEPYYSKGFISDGLDPSQTANYLYPLYDRAIDEIRSVDNNHIIIYEPVGGWRCESAQLLNKTNLIFSYHYYLEGDYSGDALALENSVIKRYMDNPTTNPVRNWNIPCFVGEFGVALKSTNSSLWMRDIVNIWKKYELGWSWWSYWKTDDPEDWCALCYANGTEKTQIVQYLRQP